MPLPDPRGKDHLVRVSGLVITHQLSAQAAAWMAQVAQVTDELVAVVADERAQPEVIARFESLGARILRPHWSGFYPSNEESRAMMTACRGDWILKVDHDEELSPEWHDPSWREVLRETDYTHFWLPRRWAVAPDEFLDDEPWRPDWQLRLLRNCPEAMFFAQQLHESMTMAGPGGMLRTLSLHHHDLWLCSREVRAEKARIYEELRPDHGLGYFYLYENWEVKRAPIPRASQLQLAREVLRMAPLSDAACHAISLATSPPPRSLRAQELFWLEVELRNGSAETLCCGAPHPLNLAYHWLHAPSREVAIFDGRRSAILPELAPGERRSWRMFLIAPAQAGDYFLQLTVVQEDVRWLETVNSNLALEFAVTVAPAAAEGRVA